jgi:hypothetical protein
VTAVTRPILPSADLAATSMFYARLGFAEIGRWPDEYLILRDDHDIELHFWCKPTVNRWTNDVACWIGFASEAAVHRLHGDWAAVGVPDPAVLNPPTSIAHLTEFQLIDLHGNLLRVGAPRTDR